MRSAIREREHCLEAVSYDTLWEERMSGTASRPEYREKWLRRARELDAQGYFSRYPVVSRREVLRKGYLGALPPDAAIRVAEGLVRNGFYFTTSKIVDEMRDGFGVVGGDSIREAILSILGETPAGSYEPPGTIAEPPGYPFVFRSAGLCARIYFKFQIMGYPKRPRVLFWSCHPPIHR